MLGRPGDLLIRASLAALDTTVHRLRRPGTIRRGLHSLYWEGICREPGRRFGSIGGVRALFGSDSALVAGWLHYLAFDLFVGTWIVRRGIKERLNPFLLLLCLPVTFLFGPVGFLLYWVERTVFARRSAVGASA